MKRFSEILTEQKTLADHVKRLKQVTKEITGEETVKSVGLARIRGNEAVLPKSGDRYEAVKVQGNWYLTGNKQKAPSQED